MRTGRVGVVSQWVGGVSDSREEVTVAEQADHPPTVIVPPLSVEVWRWLAQLPVPVATDWACDGPHPTSAVEKQRLGPLPQSTSTPVTRVMGDEAGPMPVQDGGIRKCKCIHPNRGIEQGAVIRLSMVLPNFGFCYEDCMRLDSRAVRLSIRQLRPPIPSLLSGGELRFSTPRSLVPLRCLISWRLLW